ncbi:MAG: glutamine-hydrolyzing carbamoyl-phosphate synthase small subunit [Clostridia bacterium]
MKKARLVLEDGSIFYGESFGYRGETFGEVVFATGMTGYQEMITDPSFRGQIVTLTYPLIGNYGSILNDVESSSPHIKGLVVKEICHNYSNFRADFSLAEYLQKNEIVAISGIDTRELTIKIRDKGSMRGLIAVNDLSDEKLIEKISQYNYSTENLVNEVTTETIYKQGIGDIKVGLIDCGSKRNIIRSLVKRNCEVVVMPASSTYESVIDQNLDAVVFSNGPGDPVDIPQVVDLAKKLIGATPVFGICLGHQVIALACGAKTYKMKFGHRGGNHPVKDLRNNEICVTAQNHGYAVDKESLENTDLEITHINLTDDSVEGIRHKKHNVFSVQYHPEASPGPLDSQYIFDDFIKLIKERG